MSDTASATISGIWFASFIALKFVSAYTAAWSWWWLLMPIVPVLATIFKHFA